MRFSSFFRLVSAGLIIGACLSAGAASYTLVDLGPHKYPSAINDRSEVAATASDDRALRWRNGHWRPLYDRLSRASAINRQGDVVGDIGANPMLWYHGRPGQMLPLPGGSHFGLGYGINNSRSVVGLFEANDGTIHCFQWTKQGGSVDLGFMAGGDFCQPFGINNAGQITGEASITIGGAERLPHAFIYSGGAFQDLGILRGGDRSQGLSINRFGDVAGRASVPPLDGMHFHATAWIDGRIVDLDPHGKYVDSVATGINTGGELVGTVRLDSGEQRAVRFLYRAPHGVLLQNEVLNLDGWKLEQAEGINEMGDIVGVGTAPDGLPHGFLLRPAGSIDGTGR
jgi:probable HAF family extracellular repeat protein